MELINNNIYKCMCLTEECRQLGTFLLVFLSTDMSRKDISKVVQCSEVRRHANLQASNQMPPSGS